MSALTALLVFLISFMLVAILCKMPVSYALGTSSILVLAYGGLKLSIVPQFAFSGLDSFALLAIPFYIFAGVLMEYSGIAITGTVYTTIPEAAKAAKADSPMILNLFIPIKEYGEAERMIREKIGYVYSAYAEAQKFKLERGGKNK